MAKFMLLIYSEEKVLDEMGEAAMKEHTDEYWAYDDELEAIGALVDSAPLYPVATGKTVAPGGVVTDGPFAETAEVLGGYYLIDVPDQATAVEWAQRCPGVVRGLARVEVREILEMTRS
jgi:hypothetical protein